MVPNDNGQEAVITSNYRKFHLNIRNNLSTVTVTGSGCTEMLWSLHPWRQSNLNQTWFWETCCSGCCFEQGGWTGQSLVVLSKYNYNVTLQLCFYNVTVTNLCTPVPSHCLLSIHMISDWDRTEAFNSMRQWKATEELWFHCQAIKKKINYILYI